MSTETNATTAEATGDLTLVPALNALNKLYDHSVPLFKDAERFQPAFKVDSPRPVIVIQTHGSRKDLLSQYGGAYKARDERVVDGYWLVKGKRAAEITIAAEDLAQPLDVIYAALLREMVRHFDRLAGIKDAAKSGRLNQEFKASAEAIGLRVAKNEEKASRGWNMVALGKGLEERLTECGVNAADFGMFRDFDPMPAARTRFVQIVTDTEGAGLPVVLAPPSRAVAFCNAMHEAGIVCPITGEPFGVIERAGMEKILAPMMINEAKEIVPLSKAIEGLKDALEQQDAA